MGRATSEKTTLLKKENDEENVIVYTPEFKLDYPIELTSETSDSSLSSPLDVLDEMEDSSPSGTMLKVYIMAGCAALSSCNLGFDVGVNTDAGLMIQESMSLSDVKLEAFMGSLNLFAMVGALLSSTFIDRYGLRLTFIIASLSFIIGIAIMVCSTSYATLMSGRIFVGLGVGIGFAVTPVYISEISPRSRRGFFVSWSEIGTNFGIVLGFMAGFTSYSLSPDLAWRVMFSIGFVMPIVLIILAAFVMMESPRWLVLKGREREARQVICSLHPKGYDVDDAFKTINESIEENQEGGAGKETIGYNTILCPPTPALKRMIFTGFGTAISHQLCGIDAIQYYLSFILKDAGIVDRLHQTQILTCLGVLKLLCLFVAGPMSDRFGRRPLLFISLSGMICALVLITWDTMMNERNGEHHPIITILGLATYLCFFSFGLGPLGWVLPPEIFSTSIRSKAISISTLLNRVTGTFVVSSMITLADYLTWPGYFAMLAVVNVFILLFFYLYLPETKGRSLEEMMDYFERITTTRR